MSKFDVERAARILIEAEAIGNDRKAAEKLQVSERTIRNYRKRLETDSALASLFREYVTEESRSWHIARTRALRIANQRAVALLEKEDDLDKVTRFIEKTGGVDIAGEALGVGTGNHRSGKASAADSRGGATEGAEEEGGSDGSDQGDGD